ncbi:MAG: caspase family protein [Deltaproteobacteria bacterium]|nr:caspase family protein [Deltaproteobacteria bacterium]
MRPIFRLMIIVTMFVLISLPDISLSAQSQKTALVIGNGAYKSSPLRNPANDASDIASMLKKLGFNVILKTNANQRTMKKSIRNFGNKLRHGGVGLFYYAGHAVQVHGANYLIPIGAQIESVSDIEYEAIHAGRVLGKMEDAGNGLNIIVLDSCRDNPFARSFRSSEKGLAKMDAPTGSILAYATAPGSIAADGTGRNGLYTSKLLKHMAIPGLEIEKVFKKVRIDVLRSSQKKQVPWESSSLIGEFYFNPKRGISVVKSTKDDSNLEAQQEQIEKMSKELERLKKENERKKQKPKIASAPKTPVFQNDTPETINWSDYSKPLKLGKKRITLSTPLKVRVNIPQALIKKFRKISLIVSNMSFDNEDETLHLTINGNRWRMYSFGTSGGKSKDVVKIPTKLLKSEGNIIKLFPDTRFRYEISELRFNLPKDNISSN